MGREAAERFMDDLTEGLLDERQVSALLTALTAKGPAADEIAGCAAVLSRKKVPLNLDIDSPYPLVDIVGTGGDGKGSFNISSMAALVVAACGVPVAKHGNRAVSSKSGSADFYEALGLRIDLAPERTAGIITKTGFGFLFAPVYHSAMRHAAPVRKLLGVKTIMNLVGPLSNPAGAACQVIGVYDRSLLEPVADAAVMLGAQRVMVLCSRDGFDEISPCAPTDVIQCDSSGLRIHYTIDPSDLGIGPCDPEDLCGGDASVNASIARSLMQGGGNRTVRDAVALNAAAALSITGRVDSIAHGYAMACSVLADGSVARLLESVREACRG